MEKTFAEAVDTLNSQLYGVLFFVEIGAMDGIAHDTLHQHIVQNPGWSGVLVEPLPDMFARLRQTYSDNPSLQFENAAITEADGAATITRIPASKVGRECPDWADGISTLKPDSHIISRYQNLKQHAVQQQVQTITFAALAKKHRITTIDLLQIDTEGYDKEIFDQIWAAGFRPSLIKLEILHLTYMVILELQNLLDSNGYTYTIVGGDLVATASPMSPKTVMV